MGMFDYLTCKYPLPIDGVNDRLFQSKDTPAQSLETYEITAIGYLWNLDHDVPVSLTGEIRFYDFATSDHRRGGWIEFAAHFVDGQIRELVTNANIPADEDMP